MVKLTFSIHGSPALSSTRYTLMSRQHPLSTCHRLQAKTYCNKALLIYCTHLNTFVRLCRLLQHTLLHIFPFLLRREGRSSKVAHEC